MLLIIGAVGITLVSALLQKTEIEAFERAQSYFNLWVYLLAIPSVLLGLILAFAGAIWVVFRKLVEQPPDA